MQIWENSWPPNAWPFWSAWLPLPPLVLPLSLPFFSAQGDLYFIYLPFYMTLVLTCYLSQIIFIFRSAWKKTETEEYTIEVTHMWKILQIIWINLDVNQYSIYIYVLRYLCIFVKCILFCFYCHQTGPGWFNSCFPYQECCCTKP